ncbi:glutamic acid-rich protein-like [Salvia splendens]|uniref:glutamic acid-rich protein-like n=1 Tax=Salvia splendens TaxID=180675 RepID=UPI001C25448A|nr:glutamic acid-rich protein-like [Salvia splendens]
MARNELPPGRNTNPNNNSTSPATTKAKTKNSPKTIAKSSNGSRNRITEAANGDASSEDTEVSVVPSSSVESENDSRASIHRRHIDSLATESSEAEDDGVEQRSSSNEEEEEEEKEVEEEEEEGEEEEEEENEEKKPNSVNRKGKRDNAKSKGKKRSRKEEDESEAEEKGENAQYVFPMKRINRIAKVENPDRKFFQEAVFVINRASEKFLQVFCKEAYACAFLEKKKQIAYNHLSSVVSKRKRFQFISDFVPEKTKAKDALALGEEAEMTKAKEK